MNKSLEFKNVEQLRDLINKHIQSKISKLDRKSKKINFVDDNILIKEIDYYYTNSIARSSKVMSECKQISKDFLSTKLEKVN